MQGLSLLLRSLRLPELVDRLEHAPFGGGPTSTGGPKWSGSCRLTVHSAAGPAEGLDQAGNARLEGLAAEALQQAPRLGDGRGVVGVKVGE